jgi:nitrogen fixation-related uncharacterized protein
MKQASPAALRSTSRSTASSRRSRSSLRPRRRDAQAARARRAHGDRALKQPQYQPLLFAVNNGYFDDIDVKKALAAERSLRDYLKSKFPIIVKSMEEKKDSGGRRREVAARPRSRTGRRTVRSRPCRAPKKSG